MLHKREILSHTCISSEISTDLLVWDYAVNSLNPPLYWGCKWCHKNYLCALALYKVQNNLCVAISAYTFLMEHMHTRQLLTIAHWWSQISYNNRGVLITKSYLYSTFFRVKELPHVNSASESIMQLSVIHHSIIYTTNTLKEISQLTCTNVLKEFSI